MGLKSCMVTGDNPNEVMGQKFKGPRSHLRGGGTFLHHAESSTEGLEFYTLTGHNQTEVLGTKFWNTFHPPPPPPPPQIVEHFHGSFFSVHFFTDVLKYIMVIGEHLTEDLGSKFCGRPQGNREQLQNPGTIF